QLFRRPNHEWSFYPTAVPTAIGLLVVLIALVGLWLLRREGTWRERLLLAWIIVPVAFFQLWPTKGFQYLLPIAPSFAVLAGRTLSRWPRLNLQTGWGPRLKTGFGVVTSGIVALTLFIPSWQQIQPSTTGTFL